MRIQRLAAIAASAAALLLVPHQSRANSIYNISLVDSSVPASLTGSITTDGVTGTFLGTHVLAVNLTITVAGTAAAATKLTGLTGLAVDDFTVTGNDLYFSLLPTTQTLGIQSDNFVSASQGASVSLSTVPALNLDQIQWRQPSSTYLRNSAPAAILLGTLQPVSAPEPAAFALSVIAIIGLALRRIR